MRVGVSGGFSGTNVERRSEESVKARCLVDVIGNGVPAMRTATGEIEDAIPADGKDPAAKALGKKGGAAPAFPAAGDGYRAPEEVEVMTRERRQQPLRKTPVSSPLIPQTHMY